MPTHQEVLRSHIRRRAGHTPESGTGGNQDAGCWEEDPEEDPEVARGPLLGFMGPKTGSLKGDLCFLFFLQLHFVGCVLQTPVLG